MSLSTTATKPAIVGLEAMTPVATTGNGTTRGTDHASGRKLWKVAAIIPCFNRRQDLALLFQDLLRQDLRGIDLWCVVVDNASTEPLSTLPVPAGLNLEFVRSEKNTGGSGGFNLGMSHVLSGAGLTGQKGQPDFVWWLDSDARAGKTCLRELLKVVVKHPTIGAVGSGMRDIDTGHTWEVGGAINPKHGGVWPAGGGDLDKRFLVKADYLAACSALVRRDAIEKTGLFPNNFIYYDDVDWCIQMTRKTGFRVVGAPKSKAWHPPGNRRYVTWARYYIARNCFSHMDVMGMSGWKRFRRAMREVPRAVGQCIMALPELGELHLRGLQDALNKHFPAIEPKNVVASVGFKPFPKFKEIIETELQKQKAAGRSGSLYIHPLLKSRIPGLEAFRKELRTAAYAWPKSRAEWRKRSQEGHALIDLLGALGRLVFGPTADVAVTPTGWPTNWFRGRTMIQVTTEGLIVREIKPWRELRRALTVYVRGVILSAKLAFRGPHIMPLPPAPAWGTAPATDTAQKTAAAASAT